MQKSPKNGSFSRLALNPPRLVFEEIKNGIWRYVFEECVYKVSGLYRFSFGEGTNTHVDIRANIRILPCSSPVVLLC